MIIRLAVALSTLALLAGCGSDGDTVPVVVSAPVSSQPWIARSITNGAKLAVADINAKGGVRVGQAKKKLKLVVKDNGGSPANALADARDAVSKHALAILTDGTGAASMASVTDPAHVPVFIVIGGSPTTSPTPSRRSG